MREKDFRASGDLSKSDSDSCLTWFYRPRGSLSRFHKADIRSVEFRLRSSLCQLKVRGEIIENADYFTYPENLVSSDELCLTKSWYRFEKLFRL